ncbi:beta family protein [Roseateles paludis]|jgi:hypothetical protein|uniref:T4 beta protein n=1 Tax=Roseateles paludis TaxID=3145238 RepID=A0ABV0FZ41_9BURK
MPVLKWKLGEQTAIKPLSAMQKSQLLPVAELQDRPVNWETDEYSKSWDDHIDAVVKKTVTHWGKSLEIGFDQNLTSDDGLVSGPGTVWAYLFNQLWGAGVQAVPVLSSRASAAGVAAIVAASKSAGRTRYILRYRLAPPVEDVPAPMISPAEVTKWLKTVQKATGVPASELDVAFDCGHVGQWDLTERAPWVADVIAAINAAASWRRIFLVSGGFPKNLAGVPKGTHQILRHDWALFRTASPLIHSKGCEARFGDYAISHIDPFDADPRLLKMSANLRYTQADQWFILKAGSVQDKGFGQYRDLCKLLVGLPIYLGKKFSHGDKNYNDIAVGAVEGPGNATHWRRDSTNHHVHVVLRQLTGGTLP